MKVTDVIYDPRLRIIAPPDLSKGRANMLIEKSSAHSEKIGHIGLSDETSFCVNHVRLNINTVFGVGICRLCMNFGSRIDGYCRYCIYLGKTRGLVHACYA